MILYKQFNTTLHRAFISALVALLLVANLCIPTAWAASGTAPDIKFITLASGQQVYIQEIHTQPIVTIDTWVNTGSAQETPENNGVSHFLEHLLFKGTKTYKLGEIDRILESRGADFNAATSDDFTHYHITTASPYFKEAVALHADMLLNATIAPSELDRERKVVQEEINRALDNPGRKGYIALAKLLFNEHPYALDTLGPKSNIQNLSREAILDYYHRWYQPENFKTIIVGDIDANEVVSILDESFKKAYDSQQRPVAGSPKLDPVSPLATSKSNVQVDPNTSAVQMTLGFLAPSINNREENYALDIAAIILGQGASSRLYQHIKENKQLVNSISAGNGTSQQAGTFYISAEIKPENRDMAKKAIFEEINRFKQEGPTPEEIDKAKTQVIKTFAFLNESTEGVASSIGYNVTIGSLEDYTDYVDNIQKITAEQVQTALQEYLDLNKAVLVEVIPGENNASLNDQISRNIAMLQEAASAGPSAASESRTISSTAAPQQMVSKIVLPNKATLLLKPTPSTQTVAFGIFAKGGRLAEPKPGVAGLTTRVLLKGTQNRSAQELNQELERLGISLSANSDEDYLQITGTSTSDDLSKLLLILEDVLTNPTFPQSEIEKERADLLEELKTNRDQPSNLMFEKLTEAMYAGHPYGAIGQRLEASLPDLSREDLVSFYQQQLQPENLVITVTGNFNPQLVTKSFQQILAELPSEEITRYTTYPDVQPLGDTVQVEAQKPEQAASWVAYGWLVPGISRSRDYITLKVINTLLGSGLSSRLFVDLREKQGLAYHVSSMFPSKLKQSNFVMYIGTDPRNLEKVQEGFNQEIERLKNEPVSPEELESVKSKLIGSFALAHESNANQAFYLGLYETLGVGYQFDTQYPELIKQVTAEDIQRVARTYFNRPKVVSIVSPKSIRSEASIHAN